MTARDRLFLALLLAATLGCERGRRSTAQSERPGGKTASAPAAHHASPEASWQKRFTPGVGPDVSFLNREHGVAGSHGRLVRRAAELVFEDGTVARFWGTNVTGRALFHGSDDEIRAVARRLAALGFNLVRLHHHDSPWVSPNVFRSTESTRELSPASLASIGRWVRHLGAEGIYVWLDVQVGRKFTARDGIAGFSEVEKSDHRGFDYVNPDLERRWEEFARAYLETPNPVTGLALGKDPAVVAVLLTNENDLTTHFSTRMVPDKGNPHHTALLRQRAEVFSKATGLGAEDLLETWQPGPAKVFLADLEKRVFDRWSRHVRTLGVTAPLATTSTWGDAALYSLPSLTAGDVIDVHSYGEVDFLGQDPLSSPNFATWIAAAQVDGYPLTVSEWNVPWPARDRFAAPLYVASLGALQGWDAILLYAYQQYRVDAAPSRVDEWSTVDDPALMTQLAAAALLFRRGDVAPAQKTYRLEASSARFYGSALSPKTSAALRTLFEQSRLVIGIPDHPALGWDTLPRSRVDEVVTDPDRAYLDRGAHEVRSDTGELVRNWREGVHRIDTPRTQAAAGWLGGRTIRLSDVSFGISTPAAAVSLTSLDGLPLATSQHVLLSAAAGAVPTGGHLPFLSEPVRGVVRLRGPARCATALGSAVLNAAVPDDTAKAPVLLQSTGGMVELRLEASDFAHWYVLREPREEAGRLVCPVDGAAP